MIVCSPTSRVPRTYTPVSAATARRWHKVLEQALPAALPAFLRRSYWVAPSGYLSRGLALIGLTPAGEDLFVVRREAPTFSSGERHALEDFNTGGAALVTRQIMRVLGVRCTPASKRVGALVRKDPRSVPDAKTPLAVSDRLSCAVWTLAAVTGARYDDAHAACELLADRRHGEGTHTHRLFEAPGAAPVSVLGWTFRKLPYRYETLGRFVANNRAGRIFVRVNGHALAVIDGVVHDVGSTGARSRVRTAWVATPTVPGDGAEIRI